MAYGIEYERLKKIESELERAETERQEIILVENPVPQKMRVADYVLKKAFGICKAVEELYGSMEWYGHLVADESVIRVASDIALGKNLGSSGYTEISEEEINAVVRSMPKEQVIIGWIHSHGNISGDFFSGTDVENLKKVANSVVLNTRVISKYIEVPIQSLTLALSSKHDEELLLKENSKPLALFEREGKEKRTTKDLLRYQLLEKKPSILVREYREPKTNLRFLDPKTTDIKVLVPYFVGWSYNIVVNNRGQIHQELSVMKNRSFSDIVDFQPRNEIELEIVETGREIDYLALKKEVKKKVRPGYSYAGTSWIRSKVSSIKEAIKPKTEPEIAEPPITGPQTAPEVIEKKLKETEKNNKKEEAKKEEPKKEEDDKE